MYLSKWGFARNLRRSDVTEDQGRPRSHGLQAAVSRSRVPGATPKQRSHALHTLAVARLTFQPSGASGRRFADPPAVHQSVLPDCRWVASRAGPTISPPWQKSDNRSRWISARWGDHVALSSSITARVCLLRLAQRVREMMSAARTDVAKEQLRIWGEEFEEQAAALNPRVDAEPK